MPRPDHPSVRGRKKCNAPCHKYDNVLCFDRCCADCATSPHVGNWTKEDEAQIQQELWDGKFEDDDWDA